MRALVSLNSQTVAINIETNVQNDIKYIFREPTELVMSILHI